MGYNMKRGNSAVPFKELGSSPAKKKKETDLPNLSGTTSAPIDLTVKHGGPVEISDASLQKNREDAMSDVDFEANYEGSKKVMHKQRQVSKLKSDLKKQ